MLKINSTFSYMPFVCDKYNELFIYLSLYKWHVERTTPYAKSNLTFNICGYIAICQSKLNRYKEAKKPCKEKSQDIPVNNMDDKLNEINTQITEFATHW